MVGFSDSHLIWNECFKFNLFLCVVEIRCAGTLFKYYQICNTKNGGINIFSRIDLFKVNKSTSKSLKMIFQTILFLSGDLFDRFLILFWSIVRRFFAIFFSDFTNKKSNFANTIIVCNLCWRNSSKRGWAKYKNQQKRKTW